MTPNEIISDIKSDRIKKIIVDCDTGADGDDQFAFALSLRSPDRVTVLAVNSAPFNEPSDMVLEGQRENATIAGLANPDNPVPSYKGSPDFITRAGAPLHSDAAENIARLCNESDEPLYVIISGCCTNVASALALHPEIADKLIVVWLALDNLDNKHNTGEYNYHNDIEAGKLLFRLAKNMVLAVAGNLVAPFARSNEQIRAMFGQGDALCQWLVNRFEEITWACGLWDYCADGILVCPEAFTYEICDVPQFGDDGEITSFDTSRQMVAVKHVNHDMLIADVMKRMTGNSNG